MHFFKGPVHIKSDISVLCSLKRCGSCFCSNLLTSAMVRVSTLNLGSIPIHFSSYKANQTALIAFCNTGHSVLTSNSLSNLICLCKNRHVQHISAIHLHLSMFYTFLQRYQLTLAKKSSKFSTPCALCFNPLNAGLPFLIRVHYIWLQGSCSVSPFTWIGPVRQAVVPTEHNRVHSKTPPACCLSR